MVLFSASIILIILRHKVAVSRVHLLELVHLAMVVGHHVALAHCRHHLWRRAGMATVLPSAVWVVTSGLRVHVTLMKLAIT